MKIYRILGNKGNTTVPWQIRDAMDLRASDVISFEYGSFGEDVIVLRRELCADGGLDDCEYPDPDAPDGGEFADELDDEPNEDLEVNPSCSDAGGRTADRTSSGNNNRSISLR